MFDDAVSFAHDDGSFSVWRDMFTDGDAVVNTVAVQYSRCGEPIYIPVELAQAVAAAVVRAANGGVAAA